MIWFMRSLSLVLSWAQVGMNPSDGVRQQWWKEKKVGKIFLVGGLNLEGIY